MKKITLILIVIILMVSLVGCGNGGDSNVEESTSGESASDEAKVIEFKIAHLDTEDGSLNNTLKSFEEYVEEKTEGRVDVQLFPNGQLGGDREVIEAIQLGSVHCTIVDPAVLSTYGDRFSVIGLPFLFKDFDAAIAAFDGEAGEIYNEWLAEEDFVSLGINTYGWRGISNSVRPIYKPEDLNGIKLRVPESPLYISLFGALGANPTPMAYNEVYTGLQQGTIEGQDNSPETTYLARFHEVQDYYSTLNHILSTGVIISKKSFIDSLPADIKAVIEEGMKLYPVDTQRANSERAQADYLARMAEEGVEVNEIPEENKQLFLDKASVVYDQYREIVGDEYIDLLLTYSE